jgi:hypothetical protein
LLQLYYSHDLHWLNPYNDFYSKIEQDFDYEIAWKVESKDWKILLVGHRISTKLAQKVGEVDIAILYNYLKMYEDDTADEWALLNDKKLNSGMTMVHILSINGIDWRDMKRVINTTEEDVEEIIPDEYEI